MKESIANALTAIKENWFYGLIGLVVLFAIFSEDEKPSIKAPLPPPSTTSQRTEPEPTLPPAISLPTGTVIKKNRGI